MRDHQKSSDPSPLISSFAVQCISEAGMMPHSVDRALMPSQPDPLAVLQANRTCLETSTGACWQVNRVVRIQTAFVVSPQISQDMPSPLHISTHELLRTHPASTCAYFSR